MPVFLYCYGTGCPIKETCLRYRPKLNPKKHFHFGFTPYNHEENKCPRFLGLNGENLASQIEFYLKAHENGEDHNAI